MGASIPLTSLDLNGNERRYLLEAFDSGFLTHRGTFEARLEAHFKARFAREAIFTSSGTGALHICLMALGIGPGDEVLVPDLTFGATASVVKNVGAKAVLVDVGENWQMDIALAKAAITPRTKAAIPVHLYGERCAFAGLNVPIIEDACEAMGLVEPAGDFTCYSFYGNKMMSTGEGGLVLCEPRWRHRLELMRDGGFDENYFILAPGLNYRATNMQAAIGLAQAERLDTLVGRRMDVIGHYRQRLKGRGRWLFCAESRNPRSLAAFLKARAVETRPLFYPLHLTNCFKDRRAFPNATAAWLNHLCLPTGPHLSEPQVDFICDLVEEHEHGAEHVCGPEDRAEELG